MNAVTRFTSECDLCAELLTEYIAAANETIDTKRHAPATEPSSRQLASALIDHALKRRNWARKELLTHKRRQH